MFSSIQVIDDFCADPMALRSFALTLTYEDKRPGDNFQGRNSRETVLPENPDQVFSEILREPVTASPPAYMHGRFRVALADEPRDVDVHVDAVDGLIQGCVWAGVLYLTLDRDVQGGTEFFRHHRYGTDRCPLSDEEAVRIYGAADRFVATDKVLGEEGRQRTCWEHIMTVPMRFNRAVFYRPWFWHTAGPSFGTSAENGRLVQLFFLGPVLPPDR